MTKHIKHIFLVLSLFLLLGFTALFAFVDDHPSTDAEYQNNTRSPQGSLSFSAAPGFYSESFELEILAPTGNIYYTLDGTNPDKNALRYTGPILISDATANPNVHSARTDVSAGFLPSSNVDWYAAPDYNVDKCTIIRAVYYDAYGNKSPIKTGTYFVGFDDKAAYDNIHVLSIITDPAHLFDYNTGIYVLGRYYDRFSQFKHLDWWWWDANYHNRGREWERQATIQLFSPDQKAVLTQEIGFRIQGGASRGFNPKSLNLYARDAYDGNTQVHYDFWDKNYFPEKLILSACGNDYRTKIKDRLGSELLKDYQVATMRYLPCLAFLDGEFWGMYYLTEKYDNVYIQKNYHVDRDNVIIIKHGALDHGLEGDLSSFEEMYDYLSHTDLSIEENYQTACKYLDMDSTIDYLAAMIYIARTHDWSFAGSNSQLWRSRNPGSSPYADCKWRWMVFDLNSGGMTQDLIEHNTVKSVCAQNAIVNHLCQNSRFREALAQRIIDIGQNSLSADIVNQKIDGYLDELSSCYEANNKRFSITETQFQAEIDSVRAFFDHRYDAMLAILKAQFPELDIDAMHEEASQQRSN